MQRWQLRAFGSCLAAHVLLILRLCAELTTAEQDDALGGILAGSGAQQRAGAMRLAGWPRAQRDMIRRLRSMTILRPDADGGEPSVATSVDEQSTRVSRPDPGVPSKTEMALLVGAGVGPPAAYYWVRADETVPTSRQHEACLFAGAADDAQDARELRVAAAPAGTAEVPLVTALRLLVAHRHAGPRLRTLFSPTSLDSYGAYTVQLYDRLARRWVGVVVGELLPCLLPMAADEEHTLPPWHARAADVHARVR